MTTAASWQGLIAAPFVPLHADHQPDLSRVPGYVAHLANAGVSAAFINGTTGEGASLSIEERAAVAAAWCPAARGRLKIIVHVGHTSLAEARAMARHAEQTGADAIAAIAPFFFRPTDNAQLVQWCASIAGAAPALPFFYYHMPSMSGVNVAMADFVPLALERIPNFAGVKFTHENLMDYHLAVERAAGRCAILFGRDEILLSALAVGARGAVGSTYNYFGPVYRRLIADFDRGDLAAARARQTEVVNMVEVLIRHGGVPAGKAIMRLIGVDCGPCRAPLSSLDDDAHEALRRNLDRVGFFAALNSCRMVGIEA